MGDILKHLIEAIKDKTTSLGFKTALFISILGIIFFTDYLIGFSYNYHLSNKFDQIESIQTIKKIYRSDNLVLENIKSLESEILNRKHYTDLISNVFNKNVLSNNNNQDVAKTRSIYWMVISSNYSLIVGFFTLLYVPFMGSLILKEIIRLSYRLRSYFFCKLSSLIDLEWGNNTPCPQIIVVCPHKIQLHSQFRVLNFYIS